MYLNGNLSAPFLPCTNPDSFSFFTPVFPCPGAFDHGWSRCKGSTAQRFLSRLSKPAVKTAGSRSETNEQRDKSPTKTFMETERECDQPRPWFNSNCRVLALLWIFGAIPGHLVKQLRAALAHGWKEMEDLATRRIHRQAMVEILVLICSEEKRTVVTKSCG